MKVYYCSNLGNNFDIWEATSGGGLCPNCSLSIECDEKYSEFGPCKECIWFEEKTKNERN